MIYHLQLTEIKSAETIKSLFIEDRKYDQAC